MSGITLRNSPVQLGSFTIQPLAPESTFTTITSAGAVVTAANNVFSSLAASVKEQFAFSRFEFKTVPESTLQPPKDNVYNDELPSSTAKFTPFEELSGIAETRPEILSVNVFKPLFTDSLAYTPAGEFLDAQVKLMNLRHEAVASLINDMKKDPELADQLDQVESDFLLHIRNVRSHVDFLVTTQRYIERLTRFFDLREQTATVDAASLIAQYYTSVYTDASQARSALANYTYSDVLTQQGFNKANLLGFSSTKIFLQTLFESKKMLRAGSDALLSVDPSLTSQDTDASTLNRRAFDDPHLTAAKVTQFPTFRDLLARRVHESDDRLTQYVQDLANGFKSLDNVFSGGSSADNVYALKLRFLTRESSYSSALADQDTVALLSQYGYQVNDTGNQQLFDFVYGQLGNRVTDDRSNVNVNSLSSTAIKSTSDSAVLTYEVDYLETDQGSFFTPGASYYVASTMKPSDSGFSVGNATELVTRLTNVVDRYVDFVGKFNLLPKTNNLLVSKDANVRLGFDPLTMADTLYSIFVEPNTGLLRSDVVDNPVVNLMTSAATNASLRANLHAYLCCVADVAGDDLTSAQAVAANAGADLRQEALNNVASSEKLLGRVGATVEKLIKNISAQYQQTGVSSATLTLVENALKNYSVAGPLARVVAYVHTFHDAVKNAFSNGRTRYSLLTDNLVVAVAVQSVLDSAKRFVPPVQAINLAQQVNKNFSQLAPQQPATQGSSLASLKFNKSVSGDPLVAVVPRFADLVSKLPLKQAITSQLEREDTLVVRTVLAPLNVVRVLRDGIKDFVVFLQRKESVDTINAVLDIVGDRQLVELLGDRGQVQLLLNHVEDMLARINPDSPDGTGLSDDVSLVRSPNASSDLKIFDDSFVTSRSANVVKAALASSVFNVSRGGNSKVIAFGLPHGFTSRLRNKFKLTTFAEQAKAKTKQNDVVVADFYKVDVRYPDIIFKPQARVFELSRFPVRDERQFQTVNVGATTNSALDCVPTKDYSSLESPRVSFGPGSISEDIEYDFMSNKDVEDMIRNHVMSYVLETYYRVLTGLPLSERELHMNDPDDADRPAPFVVRAAIENIVGKTFNVPVDPATLQLTPTTNSSLIATFNRNTLVIPVKQPLATFSSFLGEGFDTRQRDNVKAAASVVSDLSKKKTVYTDKTVAAKHLMSPKLFERVFFVNIDPDDFEVDYDETFKTEVGAAAFASLSQAGEIVVNNDPNTPSKDVFKLKDQLGEKQMTFEKYFVVVRSYVPLAERSP